MTTLHQNDKILHAEMSNTKPKSPERQASITNMPVDDHITKRYDNITKSPNDKRLYRGLLLKNRMKVLLISDPTTDKSAASLDVNAGYMNDPDELPGLAHFCEHMLFLGTEKYPEQNTYNMFLSQNGGSSNAATSGDHTNYYFDVTSEKLKDALDRFAQFFLKPLFTESLTELELKAVHSEYEKNLGNDTWRFEEIEKSSSDPNHVFHKFSSGNMQTLDIIPKQKGINVRERLLEFYKTYYSANIMTLCVLGKETLDELEYMVVESFHEVEDKDVEPPMWSTHPFNEEHFQTKWYILPIKDTRNMTINFPAPYLTEYYKSKPLQYIEHLLGHEGKGSLLSALKEKGWCNSLVSGKRPSGKGFSFYTILVDLTEEGIEHIDEIITMTFQYINMLKKDTPVEWIYNELKDIANMSFQFKEKFYPRVYVHEMSQTLQKFPMEDVLTAPYLFSEWRPDLIKMALEYLKPQNVRVLIFAKKYESIVDETEPHYGGKFKKEKIPSEIIDTWINAGLNSNFRLPDKNEFIPTRFNIKPQEVNVNKFPVIIEDTPIIRLWFKQDDEFLVPRSYLTFEIASPLAYIDPVSYNMTSIFVQLFRDALNEYAYAAEIAGLKYEFIVNKYGVTLAIGGYDDKLYVLLSKILDKMVTFKIDPKRFEIMKEQHIRNLKNFEADQPYQHALYYITVVLTEQTWLRHELLETCSQITVQKLQDFIPQLLSKIHVECLVHGNMTASEAIDIAKLVESKLTNSFPDITPLLPRQLLLSRGIKLEEGCHFLYEITNKYHRSSCIELYYPTGLQTTESNIHLELLAQIISEPCYSTLRTKEQLGYIVHSGILRSNGVQGLRVLVQSERHPRYVEQRIRLFLNSMMDHISNMSEEKFNKYKESLAVQRLEKPKRLHTQATLFWTEIILQQYNFDRANIEVAYLKTVTHEQIVEFFKNIMCNDAQCKISIHVISTAEGGAGTLDENAINDSDEPLESTDILSPIQYKKIEDIMAFKNSQSLYPRLQPFNNIPGKTIRSSKL